MVVRTAWGALCNQAMPIATAAHKCAFVLEQTETLHSASLFLESFKPMVNSQTPRRSLAQDP